MKMLHEKKQETYENMKNAYENRIWAGKPFWGRNQPNQPNQSNQSDESDESDESQPKKGDFAAKLLEVPDPSRQEPAPAVFLQQRCRSFFLPHFSLIFFEKTIFARCSQPVFVENTSKRSFDHHKFS